MEVSIDEIVLNSQERNFIDIKCIQEYNVKRIMNREGKVVKGFAFLCLRGKFVLMKNVFFNDL